MLSLRFASNCEPDLSGGNFGTYFTSIHGMNLKTGFKITPEEVSIYESYPSNLRSFSGSITSSKLGQNLYNI